MSLASKSSFFFHITSYSVIFGDPLALAEFRHGQRSLPEATSAECHSFPPLGTSSTYITVSSGSTIKITLVTLGNLNKTVFDLKAFLNIRYW